jgi:type IV pilus assembly protein PilC
MKLPALPFKPIVPSENGDDIILELKYESSVAEQKKTTSGFGFRLNILDELNSWLIMNSPIQLEDKLIFFELFVSVLHAGIPVGESLRLLEKQTRNPRLKIVINNMNKSIDSGLSLAESMRNQEGVFDEATCSIVEAGETSGKLNEVMRELVSQYERINIIQKKVKGVMTYPVVVIVVMILAAVVVLLFVVPELMNIFGGAESLPLPTQIMIKASNILQHQWHILLLSLVSIGGIFSYWKKTSLGEIYWSNFLLSVPLIGDFIKKMSISKIMRIFSFLIASGVPIIQGLRIASRVANNVIYEKKLLLAADDLTRGIELSENFSDDERLFPQMLVSMISVGEKTASLGSVLGKVADFYDEELNRSVSAISKMMEPIIMVFMAIGVVFLLMAIYLPILQMNDQIVG